jgi:hypothetical protein
VPVQARSLLLGRMFPFSSEKSSFDEYFASFHLAISEQTWIFILSFLASPFLSLSFLHLNYSYPILLIFPQVPEFIRSCCYSLHSLQIA